MKAFFFKTSSDKGRNRLRPLPGQTFEDGTTVKTDLNTNSAKLIRTLYPIGTIFVTESLLDSGTHYTAGDIFPILSTDTDYINPEHKPASHLIEAYKKFLGVSHPDDSDSEEEDSFIPSPRLGKKSLLQKMMDNPKLSAPSIKEDGFFVTTDNWYLLTRNILSQVNTLLVGPTGTGKTELVMLACKRLGIDCSVYDMGSMYDPVAGLLGVHRLQEGGKSVFDYAKFTQDIQKPGVILLDELSRAPVTTNNILFPSLDSRRRLPVEIAGGEDLRSIEVHPDCCFVATANIGSEYTGTMAMDKALLNRFFAVELSYLPKVSEVSLLVNRTSIEKSFATNIVSVAEQVRNLYNQQEISSSISTRETLLVSELVVDGWKLATAMELVFLPLFEGTKADGERSIVAKIIMSM